MAKQLGVNPISGTIDGYTYYFNKEYGFLLRHKGGPSKKQVKKSRQYDIPRRNMEEFGRASRYGKTDTLRVSWACAALQRRQDVQPTFEQVKRYYKNG